MITAFFPTSHNVFDRLKPLNRDRIFSMQIIFIPISQKIFFFLVTVLTCLKYPPLSGANKERFYCAGSINYNEETGGVSADQTAQCV